MINNSDTLRSYTPITHIDLFKPHYALHKPVTSPVRSNSKSSTGTTRVDVTSPRGDTHRPTDDDENEHHVRESDGDDRDERGRSRQERDATRVARDHDARESGKD